MITISAKLTFSIPFAHSLKEKRMVVRSLTDKVRHKFNVSVAEVDTQDTHQILTLGIAVVSGEASHGENMLEEIIRFMEREAEADLISTDRQSM